MNLHVQRILYLPAMNVEINLLSCCVNRIKSYTRVKDIFNKLYQNLQILHPVEHCWVETRLKDVFEMFSFAMNWKIGLTWMIYIMFYSANALQFIRKWNNFSRNENEEKKYNFFLYRLYDECVQILEIR